MATISSLGTASFALGPNQSVTVTTSPNVTGRIAVTQYVEGTSTTTTKIGPPALTETFGPYGKVVDVVITSTYGSIDYVVAAASSTDVVTSYTDPLTGGSRYVVNGPLVSDEWVSTPAVFKLLLNGTGAVTLEARDANGVVTTVFSDTLAAAVNEVAFPYAGDSAMAVRATFPTSATVGVF